MLRAGLLAGLVMWVIGFALNDSGTAIPAVERTLAIPLVIAASITALKDDDARARATSRQQHQPPHVRRDVRAGSPA